MKILVTGANGFIGQALCAELAQKGSDAHSVIRAVRTARSPGDVVLQLDDLHKAGNDLAQALSGTEVVVHLAKCDAVGTENLARQCALHGVRRLVFVSTAKVHGEGYDHAVGSPYTEQDRPQPLDAYAQSKWEAEQRLWEVAGQTNLEVVVLRPPMVYGPGVGGNFLKLMQSVSASTFFLPLPLGAIQNQRSLIYVGNLVDVIGVCLGHPHAAGQTFLVSDGQAMSTPDLIRALAQALGRPARLIAVPVRWMLWLGRLTGRMAQVQRLTGSLALQCSQGSNRLGWRAPYSVKAGLAATAGAYLNARRRTGAKARAKALTGWVYRLLDIGLSAFGLLATAPLMVVLLVAGWLDTGSPLFRQVRVGRDQKAFTLVKLRTMRPATASVASHLADPAAVTRWGRWLRRSKLDELPQLWNVLRGEMSLVGPRPCLFNQTELIDCRARLGVYKARPGITGLAQTQGIDMSDPELLAQTDAQMLAQWGLLRYFGLLFQTVFGAGGGDRVAPLAGQPRRGFLPAVTSWLLSLPRWVKRAVALTLDIGLCVLTVWLAFALRLDEWVGFTGTSFWSEGLVLASCVAAALAVPIFVVSGLYRAIFRYSGWPALMSVARAIGIYSLGFFVIFTVVGVPSVPRSVGLIQPLLLLLGIGCARGLARFWLGERYQNILQRALRPKVLVYGAGATGRQLVAAMANSHEMQVVGFLDDDVRLQGQVLNGMPVYSVAELDWLIQQLGIQHVLLAMPNIGRARRNPILNTLAPYKVAVRTLPSLNDLAQGRVNVSDVRDLDIDDLLGRDAVRPRADLLQLNILSKTVLVTGAGGSIGSELCRQIVRMRPNKLLLVDSSEFALYRIHQELQGLLGEQVVWLQDGEAEACSEAGSALTAETPTLIVPLLASVCDQAKMADIMLSWRPDTIYHAAAYKHVPLVEHNVAEGVRNNVWGTLICAQSAILAGVSNFVLISTDKAVRPTNVMGASKRLAEKVLQALHQHQATQSIKTIKTIFSMVRFGNVLDSSGSVVPLFRQQIKNGGPVTLTHEAITRYFMTIPEAAELVIQAGAMGVGGDVFVLDMGEPVKIMDLARRMIELSGLTVKDEQDPQGDIEITVSGLRPGEKLFEEMLIGDNPMPTVHPRILKAHDPFINWDQLEPALKTLQAAAAENNILKVRELLRQLVSGYQPTTGVVDWLFLARH